MSEPVVIALIAGLAVAVPPTLVAILSHRKQGKKLDDIHVLVNDRLDIALKKIEALEKAARE